MTIFSTPRLQREDMDVSEFGAGLGSTIGAAATEAVEEMPTVQLFGMREINEAKAKDRGEDLGSAIDRVMGGEDPADVMYGAPVRKRPEMIPMEARERVKEAGLDKQLTIPDGAMIEPSALDIMMERARHRQERAATIARGPSGVVPTALSVGTSFLVGAVDPVNVAAAFIPVVGELRYAKMLEAAGESAWARAGVRAQVGAASGAVGMAAIEPIAAFAKTQEGQDYTMAHALRSVIFGTVLGAGLHTGGGRIADFLRERKERPLYPFGEGEPLEFHTPFEELRMLPAGSNLPVLGADIARQAERLPDTFEEAARRLNNAGRDPSAEPAAASPADTGAQAGPAEQIATAAEGGARAAPHGETGADEQLISSPIVAMIDDLPPRAKEDAMRAATAAIIDGRPVQSGDIIAAGARADQRIAESVAEGNAHAIAQAAELSTHGRAVFDDMRGQLKRAGMSEEEAAANAAIVAARYEARAARLEGAGGTAEDLYRAEGIRVQRGGMDDELGRMFAQAPVLSPMARQAKEHFGVTRDFREAGYVLPDGSMLDMTGRHYSGGYEKAPSGEWMAPAGERDYLKGTRSVDHRELDDIVLEGGTEGMRQFMNGARAVRNMPGNSFDVTFEPTLQQLRRIVSEHNRLYRGEPLRVEISDPKTGDSMASLEFERPTVEAIQHWIDRQITDEMRGGRQLFQRRRPQEGQGDMFGGARATDADMAQRAADAPLRPDVAQKPMDEGLFGDTAKQSDLVDAAKGRQLFQPPTVPTFFSAVSRAIDSARQEKASPEQWLATLRNTPGVKPEEIKWLGIEDWLKEQKGRVTRKDIQDYVRANNIEVREVETGDRTYDNTPPDAAAEAEHVPEWNRLIAQRHELTGGDVRKEMSLPPEQARALQDIDRQVDALHERMVRETLARAGGEQEAPKFASYTLPGGENYRELLLTLPEKPRALPEPELRQNARGLWAWFGGDTQLSGAFADRADATRARPDAERPALTDANNYRSSHFHEPNILSHIRFNDRTIDGKKTLFIEEIQSDWHQAGKRKGYQGEPINLEPLIAAETEARMARTRATEDAWRRFTDGKATSFREATDHGYGIEAVKEFNAWRDGPEYQRLHDEAERTAAAVDEARHADAGKVPDAPFKTTWPELAFKRMIRYAAENGYEKIAWTPGEVQAERYDLSKKVHHVVYYPDEGRLIAVDHGGAKAIDQTGIAPEKLPDYIGKDVAEKLLNEPANYNGAHLLEGPDLKVGGEGMKGFYDKILPATVNKLVKKYGAKVEDENLVTERDVNFDSESGEARYVVDQDGNPVDVQSVHTIDLTEPLRKAATEEGFPLFQREPGGEMRGRITLADNKAIIDLFGQSDRSTFMHETGHLWLDELARDAARENAPEGIRKDMETVLKWLGAERADAITTEQHENWARGFETYLTTGKAPTEGLAAVFQQFKDWLTAIYKGIVGSGQPISDDIRAVMDRMIATPAQIEREAADRAATVHMGPKPARGPRARDPETWHLFEFLADRGGLRPDPEMTAMFGGTNPFIPGFGKLIRKGGMGLDQAREAAVEAGYLHDAPAREAELGGTMQARPSESTERDLLEAMDRQSRGEKVYREGHEAKRPAFDPDEEMHAVETELNGALADVGMQPHEISGKVRERTIEIMQREGERDPLAAYERAVMEGTHDGAQANKNERLQDHISGWDQVSHDAGAAQPPGGPVETIRGPAGPGAGEGPRGAGGGNRGAAETGRQGGTEDTWRRLADTPRDFNEPDVIAASKRADALPEPASVQPDKRLAAAQKADADSAIMYEAQAEYLPADLKSKLEQDLRLLEQDGIDTAEVVRRGAACLAAGVVAGAAI